MLQTTQCDDRNFLGCSKGHPLLQEPVGRSDDGRFACSPVWSYVRRSLFSLPLALIGARAVRLYLVGLYEQIPGNNWEWFFHADLAPALGHSARYFIRAGEYTCKAACVVLELTLTNERAVHQALSFLVHMLGYLFILLALFNMCWVTVFPGIMLTDSPLTSFILVVTIGPAFLSKCLFIYWLIYYC